MGPERTRRSLAPAVLSGSAVIASVPAQRRPGSVPGGDVQSLLAGGARALTSDSDVQIARQRFEAAYELAERAGDAPAMVLAALGLASLSVREHRGGTEPAELLARLRQTLATAARDGTGADIPAGPPPRGRTAPAEPARCSRHGQQWRIAWGSRTAVIENSIGLLHLAVLLANPGQEIPAIDLVTGVAALTASAAVTSAVSSQPLLDPTAARQYRRRLAQLKAELAESDGEPHRAVRTEHDWLVAELASATGMGGRTRQFTDSTERARLAAGRAIRRALIRIEDADSAIGQHLRASIRTGIRCSYRPA